jgi:DNA-binding LacI/PurR family transcriptional regulator
MQGSPHVTEDKRRRVLQAAESLGYLNNGLASSLAGNRSHHLIGLLAESLSNPIFATVFDRLAEVLRAHEHAVVVMQGSTSAENEDRALRELVTLRPDGLILLGYAGSTSALAAAVHSIPVVSVTRKIEMLGVSSVFGDDDAGGSSATEHLIALGHTDIVHVGLPESIPYEGRATSYRTTMRHHNLVPRIVLPEFSVAGARDQVLELRREERLPTAFFCANDVLALGVLDGLRGSGLRVPEDVSVVGYDNTDQGAREGLTSIDQKVDRQATIAAETLSQRLEDPGAPAESWTVPVSLVTRRTTAAPPR